MILGIDDTDSRTDGMCTTYLATRLAERLERAGAAVDDRLLFRLNPNVPWKTRGNGCLALHVDAGGSGEAADADAVWDLAVALLERHAVLDDPDTNPGLALLPDASTGEAAATSQPIDRLADHALRCVRAVVAPEDARRLADDVGARLRTWGSGRGAVGAVAALGAARALERWGDATRELLAYRDGGWATPRVYGDASFRAAQEATAPATWDTVDPATGDVVAVPNTDGPVLYGLRGETRDAVTAARERVDCRGVDRTAVFRTNQGTDMHVVPADASAVEDRGSYRVAGTVTAPPETREGGHVFVEVDGALPCAAFEPTGGFRDAVRALRVGDRVTVCGGVSDDTLNCEKLRVDGLRRWQRATPRCAGCGRTMESAGSDQGYRCRDCGASAAGRVAVPLDRDLATGWHEVPPGARRHLAMPLARVRSGAASEPAPCRDAGDAGARSETRAADRAAPSR